VEELDLVEGATILRGTVGSTAHGLHHGGQDDRDEMAVFVEPPEYLIGLALARKPGVRRPFRLEHWCSERSRRGRGPGTVISTLSPVGGGPHRRANCSVMRTQVLQPVSRRRSRRWLFRRRRSMMIDLRGRESRTRWLRRPLNG
jgi:RNA repair pathway DNA polymerase beta family